MYHQLPAVYENSTCNGFQLDVSIAETNGALSTQFYMEACFCHLIRKVIASFYLKILTIFLAIEFISCSSDFELWDVNSCNCKKRVTIELTFFSLRTEFISLRKFIPWWKQPSIVLGLLCVKKNIANLTVKVCKTAIVNQ